jgi:uncharacterized RDD family membrane protein YckC
MHSTSVTGRRVGAALIDLVAYGAVCLAVFFAVADSAVGKTSYGNPEVHVDLGQTSYFLEGGSALGYWAFTILVAFAYFGVLPGLTGWTAGKLVTRLRVVTMEGSPTGVGRGLLRALLWIVDGFPYFLPGLVGFVAMLARGDHRRVADVLAGSHVIDARSAEARR